MRNENTYEIVTHWYTDHGPGPPYRASFRPTYLLEWREHNHGKKFMLSGDTTGRNGIWIADDVAHALVAKHARWSVRGRDTICAVKGNFKPSEKNDNVPTVCGHFIVLSWGAERQYPTCPDCQEVLERGVTTRSTR